MTKYHIVRSGVGKWEALYKYLQFVDDYDSGYFGEYFHGRAGILKEILGEFPLEEDCEFVELDDLSLTDTEERAGKWKEFPFSLEGLLDAKE
jgi:hypothetical protein